MSIKAMGIIEVLIVMGIAGTVVIGISQLAVSAFQDIRNDELIEYGNGVMIQALEIAKAPSAIKLTSVPNPANLAGSYVLNTETTPPSLTYSLNTTSLISDCAPNSPYYIDADALFGVRPTVCIQVVLKQTAVGSSVYEVISHVWLEINSNVVERVARTYRYQQIDVQR